MKEANLTIFVHVNIFWCKENRVMNEGHTIIIIHQPVGVAVGKLDKVVGKIIHTHAGNDLLPGE